MSEAKLYTCRAHKMNLIDSINSLVKTLNEYEKHYALLYAPHKCFLATVNRNGEFEVNEGRIEVNAVFEARVFNRIAELRWLNESDGEGAAVVLCEDNTKTFLNANAEPFKPMNNELVGKIQQSYLLWGESNGASDNNNWTKFAEARIGSFFVPVGEIDTSKKQRAQFTAVEYLGEFDNGNVAVAEERLTGIEVVE